MTWHENFAKKSCRCGFESDSRHQMDGAERVPMVLSLSRARTVRGKCGEIRSGLTTNMFVVSTVKSRDRPGLMRVMGQAQHSNGTEGNTWEYAEHVNNTPERVAEFHRRNPAAPRCKGNCGRSGGRKRRAGSVTSRGSKVSLLLIGRLHMAAYLAGDPKRKE